ncbi:hypothetical protein NDU88_002141 [Pleurodeles waltl]|uniref:Uncharacterized protein n=1 Tax=Pleurodeles waltl TaxID=8319 RepID=A0AAV7Q5S4_PLEWA|nr:hypothetical protein NDU88_002141 [Pleurodeles waltl]
MSISGRRASPLDFILFNPQQRRCIVITIALRTLFPAECGCTFGTNLTIPALPEATNSAQIQTRNPGTGSL